MRYGLGPHDLSSEKDEVMMRCLINDQWVPAGRRVLVCGGRDYGDYAELEWFLDAYHRASTIELLIEGEAEGADKMSKEWAFRRANCIPVLGVPANWVKYQLSAGPLRNRKMITLVKPEVVIAFRGKNGTNNMIKQAREFNIPVIKVGWIQKGIFEILENQSDT